MFCFRSHMHQTWTCQSENLITNCKNVTQQGVKHNNNNNIV